MDNAGPIVRRTSSSCHSISASHYLLPLGPQVSRKPFLPIFLFHCLSIDFPFSSVPRHLPNNALSSELTIELRIDAFTAMINIQALATFLTESGFMFVADPHGPPVRMISAFHRFFCPVPFFSRFETGRGRSSTYVAPAPPSQILALA
jgi:hypothetical protein